MRADVRTAFDRVDEMIEAAHATFQARVIGGGPGIDAERTNDIRRSDLRRILDELIDDIVAEVGADGDARSLDCHCHDIAAEVVRKFRSHSDDASGEPE